jgi:hypothetical protein
MAWTLPWARGALHRAATRESVHPIAGRDRSSDRFGFEPDHASVKRSRNDEACEAVAHPFGTPVVDEEVVGYRFEALDAFRAAPESSEQSVDSSEGTVDWPKELLCRLPLEAAHLTEVVDSFLPELLHHSSLQEHRKVVADYRPLRADHLLGAVDCPFSSVDRDAALPIHQVIHAVRDATRADLQDGVRDRLRSAPRYLLLAVACLYSTAAGTVSFHPFLPTATTSPVSITSAGTARPALAKLSSTHLRR